MVNDDENGDILPHEFMSAEFDYIATTATQANEDRARVTSFYVVAVGSILVAILTGVQNGLDETASLGFAILFGALSAAGWLTMLQLVRLREAWGQSVEAMNYMKDFYVKTYSGSGVNLSDAFLWKMETIPGMYKPGSVAVYLAFQVAVLEGLTVGAAIYFAVLSVIQGQGESEVKLLWWVGVILIGLVVAIVQMLVYRRHLNEAQRQADERRENYRQTEVSE